MKKILKSIYEHLAPRKNPENLFEEFPLFAYMVLSFLIAYGIWVTIVVFKL